MRLASAIIVATASGRTPLIITASFAGSVMTSSASPWRHASITCAAARAEWIDMPGIESEIVNHVNSSRWRPLNHALNGDPVRIMPGQTVVRSEERRVGKECKSGMAAEQYGENDE